LVDIFLWNNKKNGIDIVDIIRSKYLNIPIVIISWFSEIEWIERWFDSWANDYIIKPFRLQEIEIRILKWFKTYLVSLNLKNDKIIEYKNLVYNLSENEFYYKFDKITLTKKNKYLLLIFLSTPEKMISEKYLVEKIRWDIDFVISRNLRVNILRLKKSLSFFWIENWIVNTRWEGYILKN
jgi:DNA-binding response OmpR family regulator